MAPGPGRPRPRPPTGWSRAVRRGTPRVRREARTALGQQDVDHRRDVEHQCADPDPGHPLDELVDLDRNEERRRDDREVLAPALEQPEPDTFAILQRAIEEQTHRDPQQRGRSGLDDRTQRVHDRGVVQAVVQLVGQRLDQRQVVVEGALDRVPVRPEPEHAIRRQEDEGALDEPLGREQAEHDRVPQLSPAKNDRRLVRRTTPRRLAQHEVAAAQAAPCLPDWRLRSQPRPQRVLARRVRHVAAAAAGAQVPVHMLKLPPPIKPRLKPRRSAGHRGRRLIRDAVR